MFSLFALTAAENGFGTINTLPILSIPVLPNLLGDAPQGEYEGSWTKLGQTITGNLKFEASGNLVFSITGVVTVDCPTEPFTYADGKVSLTNIDKDDDCAKKALDQYSAKLNGIDYDESADVVTVHLGAILPIDLVLNKKALLSSSAPAGEYKGSKTVLGETIKATMKFSTDTAEFVIEGPLTVDCSGEPYTYSDGKISLTNIGDDDDCVKKALDDNDAQLKSAKYDESSDTVTVSVKYHFLTVDFELTKASLELPAPLRKALQKLLASGPAGQYDGSKTVLGETIKATMKFSTDTAEFIVSGPLSLDCSGEPYTYSDGKISLTNIGNDDDCVKKALDDNDAELKSANYDESSDTITISVKYKFLTVSFDLNKASNTLVVRNLLGDVKSE